jgi:hypothetical protein
MIDGIKIKSPTRVQAGKYFKVKIISKSEKISGSCWLDRNSEGFVSGSFKMKNGTAKGKILPIQTGPGKLSFHCGTNFSNVKFGGSRIIYIAP